MGYAVYEDFEARMRGVTRWAGYGVPAICDHPDCSAEINRGMGYRCEERWIEDEGTGEEAREEGCMLFFCGEHSEISCSPEHDDFTPKPDTQEWVEFILTDESWAQWRAENPKRVEWMKGES